MPQHTINLFISAVSDEFKSYRHALREYVDRPGVRVEEQASFIRNGFPILTELNDYIRNCDAVIHLAGDRTGNVNDDGIPGDENRNALLAALPDLPQRLKLSDDELRSQSYTQWEAMLALYHNRRLFVALPDVSATMDSRVDDSVIRERQRQSQQKHLTRLERLEKYPDFRFESRHHLCLRVYRVLYDVLPRPEVLISQRMPPSLGRLFKGREAWLARIRETLRANDNDDSTRVVLRGMGGLGKTQLAAEYAYAFAHEHIALLIVSAESKTTLESGLADLCGTLKLPQAASTNSDTRIKAALDWLSSAENRGWLLIVDNVDDQGMFGQVVAQVRTLHRGHVILTSRISNWPQGFVDLELDLLDPEAATDYLLEATNGKRVSLDAERGAGADRELAAEIARELGNLALGIVQAAGTINTLRLSMSDYLSQWKSAREELLDDPDFDPVRLGYPRSVASTWLASYKQLPPESALIFDALCWLCPEPIPERIVTQSWPDDLLQLIPDSVQEPLQRRRTRAMIPLYDFSLATSPTGSQRLFTIHRLVQEVGRIWQRKESAQPVARWIACRMLEHEFVRPDDFQNIRHNMLAELCPVEPHVHAVLNDPDYASRFPRQASGFYRKLAELYRNNGRLAIGQQYAESAVDLANQDQQSNDSVSLFNLADALSIQCQINDSRGNYDMAMKAGKQQLSIMESLCQREPDNLAHRHGLGIALNNVGCVLEKKGNQEGALKLFLQSQEISKQLCQREPDNMAHRRELGIALNNVGGVLDKKGDQEGALKLFLQSQEISEQLCQLEPENLAHRRELGIALESVGRVLEEKGDQEGALNLYLQSQEISEQLCQLEPENLSHRRELGIVLNNVGHVLLNKGDQEGALKLFMQSQEIREQLCQLEPDNLAHRREFGAAFQNLGSVLENKGDQEGALKLFLKSQEISKQLCQLEPDNLMWQWELANSRCFVGDLLIQVHRDDEGHSQLRFALQSLKDLKQRGSQFAQLDDVITWIEDQLSE